ncbi:FAD-dependent oxidoreductase [Streptomyces fuscichromogenes]|uniref:FAD-dependent oxidoreductase n=1 Tax=Streptomyces fuscichromogenes TaxID=1324013 RepID=UPI003808EB41
MPGTKPSSARGDEPAVLIVGAGPTGLVLACELARAAIPCRVVEAAPGPRPGSRGKGVQPRSLEVFDDLGVVDQVLANGRADILIRSTAADGQVSLGGAKPQPARPDIPYPTTLITPQWRVEEALRSRLAELGVPVEFGTSLDSFEQSPDAVSAVLVKDGEAETVTTRWLVGCDGGHSAVRKQAGISFEGETREEVRMIVADLDVDGLDRDDWHMWWHPEGLVGLCPLPSTGQFQYQATIAPGVDPDLGPADLQAILERRSGRTDIRLRPPRWTTLWRSNVRLADRYREGRVFLAGDAAHVHAPAGGQGMNTGMQDAHNLGWKLAAVEKGAAPALLDTYEAERRPVATGVLELSSTRLEQAIEQKDVPIHSDERTRQLGVGYRGSVLARDDRDGSASLRAGDRAPDATGLLTTTGERRLFDLTRGGHFTLLDFGTEPPALSATWADIRTLHVVAEPAGPDDLADPAGRLADAYGADAPALVLIRPDGYIAVLSDAGDATAVSDWLAPFTTYARKPDAGEPAAGLP